MANASALKAPPRRTDRGPNTKRKPVTMSEQARVALTLVIVFAAAFVSVIGLKIYQERRDLVSAAELSQARAAAFVAERTASRLALANAAVSNAASSVALFGIDEAASILDATAAHPLIGDVALINDAGEVVGASDTGEAGGLAAALSGWSDGLFWLTPTADGSGLRLLTAARLALDDTNAVIVAEVDAFAALPAVAGAQVLVLADADGRVLSANDAPGAPAAGTIAADAFGVETAAVQRARANAGGAVPDALIADGGRGVIGVVPVANSQLTVLLAGQPRVDGRLWRSTLIFYLLLLVAPILVAIGLCAVLLMQMQNIRDTREALEDQERRFRVAIESARCGVWDWDLTNDTVFVTDSLARMFGRKRSSTMKASEFLSLVRAQDREKLEHAIRNAPNADEVDVEFRAYSLPVWLHARGRPWTGAGDAPSGRVVGVAIDVTEQKGAQARVTAAESRLRAALESVSESFVLWDARRRLVLSNKKYREFFNLDTKLVKPGAAYEMLELAARAAIKEAHPSVEDGAKELELADGRWIHFSERRTNDGGLVSIGTDVTALKRQESLLIEREKQAQEMVTTLSESQQRIADLARSYEQEKIRAQEANRSKSEFLANMSHELRTPLNAINGFSEIMVQQMFGALGDDRYVEYASDILSSGEHLLALINDILDMSKIEAGKMKLSFEETQPDEIAKECARLVRGRAQESGLDLHVEVNEMPSIIADPRAVKQVILNLLTNAIKFTPEGGRVLIDGRGVASGVRFRVIDTGIGIAKDDLKRIGKPFEQIESQQSKSHHGSGLGLALSRSLVEMHGGRLSLESEPDKGTTVTVEFPLRAESPDVAPRPEGAAVAQLLEPAD